MYSSEGCNFQVNNEVPKFKAMFKSFTCFQVNSIQTSEVIFLKNQIKTFIPGKPQPDISCMGLNLYTF